MRERLINHCRHFHNSSSREVKHLIALTCLAGNESISLLSISWKVISFLPCIVINAIVEVDHDYGGGAGWALGVSIVRFYAKTKPQTACIGFCNFKTAKCGFSSGAVLWFFPTVRFQVERFWFLNHTTKWCGFRTAKDQKWSIFY